MCAIFACPNDLKSMKRSIELQKRCVQQDLIWKVVQFPSTALKRSPNTTIQLELQVWLMTMSIFPSRQYYFDATKITLYLVLVRLASIVQSLSRSAQRPKQLLHQQDSTLVYNTSDSLHSVSLNITLLYSSFWTGQSRGLSMLAKLLLLYSLCSLPHCDYSCRRKEHPALMHHIQISFHYFWTLRRLLNQILIHPDLRIAFSRGHRMYKRHQTKHVFAEF